MSYHVKYYPRPVGSNAKTHIETIAMEFIVCLICAGSALMSYDSLIVMFVPNAVLAVTFFLVTIYNIYQSICDFCEQKLNQDKLADIGSNA